MVELVLPEPLDPLTFEDWSLRAESCSGEDSWYRYTIINRSGDLLATPQRSFDDPRRSDDQRRIDLTRHAPNLYRMLLAASHALRSYQYGNGSIEIAQSTADEADRVLRLANPKART